jgi:ATP-binding cassette subfamily B protein
MDEQPEKIGLRHSLNIIMRMLRVAVSVRPVMLGVFAFGAATEIAASIVSIYASARLAALLAAYVTKGYAPHIWLWLWVDIAMGALIGLSFLVMGYGKRLLYYAYSRWSINTFLNALSTLDIGDYYDEKTRNEINKVSGAYTWQLSNLSESTLELCYGVVRFIAITVVVAEITWWLVPVIALFLIPTLLAERKAAQLQWFVWEQKGDERHIFWGLDSIIRQVKGQMELRSLQATKYVRAKIDTMNNIFYTTQEKEYRKSRFALTSTKLIETIGTAVGSIVVLKQLLSHKIALDKYFFLSGALLRVGSALNNIFGTISRMQEPLLFASSYFELTDRVPKIVDNPQAVKLSKNTAPEIVFEDLSFNYPKQDRPVFDHLNLTIKAGEHIALVGENGAGKSTLIKLLLRFYTPTSGRILIDGVDLKDIAIESWYEHIATLFQDFNQYPLPIDENIEIGRSNLPVNQKLLHQAAKFGSVDKLVDEYKDGWKTVLDSSFKRGVEPSGGQWQRVALARSFYRDASMLILDEPTSAIDANAEYEIFNNIFEHYQDRTTLIVSHRFSTVRRADRIVVLEEGKIIEQGSHQDLMMRDGMYHKLFTNQAEGYRD